MTPRISAPLTEEEQAPLIEEVQRLRAQNALLETVVGASDSIFVKDRG